MTNFFTHHGLPLLFLVVMIESFGIPLPGETALIAFGVLAAEGHYSIWSVIGVAAAGAIDGAFQTGGASNLGLRSVEGRAAEPREQWTALTWTAVSTGPLTVQRPTRIGAARWRHQAIGCRFRC